MISEPPYLNIQYIDDGPMNICSRLIHSLVPIDQEIWTDYGEENAWLPRSLGYKYFTSSLGLNIYYISLMVSFLFAF